MSLSTVLIYISMISVNLRLSLYNTAVIAASHYSASQRHTFTPTVLAVIVVS